MQSLQLHALHGQELTSYIQGCIKTTEKLRLECAVSIPCMLKEALLTPAGPCLLYN